MQLGKCRRPHNRLGFAYQVAFVRLFYRFPQQQPLELFEELVCFSAAQLGLDAELIELYRNRQPTISEHQQTIAGYLRLRPFTGVATLCLAVSCIESRTRRISSKLRAVVIGYASISLILLSGPMMKAVRTVALFAAVRPSDVSPASAGSML